MFPLNKDQAKVLMSILLYTFDISSCEFIMYKNWQTVLTLLIVRVGKALD
jgi:hypothetical protein